MPKQVASSPESIDAQFEELLKCVNHQFNSYCGPLFRTDASNLYQLYLANLPVEERQSHTCGACEVFFRRYAHLVRIDNGGKTHSLMWGNWTSSQFYSSAVAVLKTAVESARVTGIFLTTKTMLGTAITLARTRNWTHFSVTLAEDAILKSLLQTPHQAMAEKLEDHKI